MALPIKRRAPDAEEQRRLRAIEAFKAVFGLSEGTRTEAQNLVWRELGLMGYERRPVFVADAAGSLCPLRAAMTDGRRSLWADIKANVEFVAPRDASQQQPNRTG